MGVKTSDIPAHAAKKAEAAKKAQQLAQYQAAVQNLSGKTFGELLPTEKDDLLKAVGLRLGLIAPD